MMRRLSLLAVAAIAAGAFAGCGGGGASGGDVVARVAGGGTVTRAQVEHWQRVMLETTQARIATAPDPPGYEKCVAASRKQLDALKPAAGTTLPKVSDAQLRKGCEGEYEKIKGQALRFLIQSIWLRREAAARGVTVTSADIAAQKRRDEAQAGIGDEASLRRYLAAGGMTMDDYMAQVRVHALAVKLGEQQTTKVRPPTPAQIAAYYAQHSSELVAPGTPAKPLTLAQARKQIRTELMASARKRVLDPFMASFQTKWRRRTSCDKAFAIADCQGSHAPTPAS
jgi:hypothetical protein